MALLFGDERAAKVVLSFLWKTKVGQMVTIPPRDGGRGRGGGGNGSGVERDEVEGEEGQGPPPDCLKGRCRGWAASRTGCDVGSAFLAFGGVFFTLFLFASLPSCSFSSGEEFGGKETEVPRLNGRTLHFGAGKCSLGTGLGRKVKVEKPSRYHSPFGLDAAG